MFDWRGFTGNTQLNKTLNLIDKEIFPFSEIEIPQEHRKLSLYTTALEEIRHNYIIKSFDEFLAGEGVMQTQLQAYEEHLSFVFLLAQGNEQFITSDNPSFTFKNKDGHDEPILIALPRLAVSLAKKDPDAPLSYRIIELNDTQVAEYNSQVFTYAKTLVLSDKEIDVGIYMK